MGWIITVPPLYPQQAPLPVWQFGLAQPHLHCKLRTLFPPCVVRQGPVPAFLPVNPMNKLVQYIHGFSLVEVMVAGVIFSIAVVGVFSSLAAVKKPIHTSDKSLDAALCGQQVLEGLRASVDASNWNEDSSPLKLKPDYAPASVGACVGYTLEYAVTDAGNGARKVTLTVAFPD